MNRLKWHIRRNKITVNDTHRYREEYGTGVYEAKNKPFNPDYLSQYALVYVIKIQNSTNNSVPVGTMTTMAGEGFVNSKNDDYTLCDGRILYRDENLSLV